MKRGLLIFTLVFLIVLQLASCNKTPSSTIDNRPPQLSVNKTEMNLSGSSRYDQILIVNAGGGQLKWSIAEKPSWLNVSNMVGWVTQDTFVLKLQTNFAALEYGTHTGILRIESNGGNAEIQLRLVYRAPVLGIDVPIVNMDRRFTYTQLEIRNAGGGELVWKIDRAPEWLKFEVTSGSVFDRPEKVPFRARLRMLKYGQYQDEVKFVSNGGEHLLKVFLTYEREVEVYPGVGAANVDLGDTYTMVQNKLGKPDRNWYERPEKTVFIHHFTYDDLGVHFSVTTNSMILYGSGKVNYIEVYAPYDGLTPEMIGIGSASGELVQKYGQPLQKNGDAWIYPGITYIVQAGRIVKMILKDETITNG